MSTAEAQQQSGSWRHARRRRRACSLPRSLCVMLKSLRAPQVVSKVNSQLPTLIRSELVTTGNVQRDSHTAQTEGRSRIALQPLGDHAAVAPPRRRTSEPPLLVRIMGVGRGHSHMKVCRARSARRHSCQGRTQQRALRLSQATGLKWVILNSGKPQDGIELGNRPLAAALLFKSTFLKLPAIVWSVP